MKLYFRLIWLLLTARFQPNVPVMGPCRTKFRVWPTDLDVLRHMNNGQYLILCDLARMDILIRSGLLSKIKNFAPMAVVAAETIQFSRSLEPFESFEIETRALGWDDRLLYLQQQFIRGEQVIATAVVSLRFVKRKGGTVDPAEVLAHAGEATESPELPDWVRAWSQNMRELRAA
ncbi:thioesterase family protein [Hymenobacter sp. BT635]|uniref:Thioesterase family protein n=1 Tax=Hymenobacter nitidus TaxID=2880929 RepID=A0ABS8AHC8_9BACT|nr:thioesterase family protein [Hymenobacter nitidus]MCB2379855.1 thioesterase family protein [Hymenobacter nitidus]